MDKQQIIADCKETFDGLQAAVKYFNDNTFNEIPFDGSWTAGQVVEHVILVASGFVQVLAGEVTPTERQVDALIPKFKSDFLDFDTKMNAPSFVLPPYKAYDKQEQITRMLSLEEKLINLILTMDLTQICVGFQLPVYGSLTRVEAVYFVVYHTQRHVNQLNEINRILVLA